MGAKNSRGLTYKAYQEMRTLFRGFSHFFNKQSKPEKQLMNGLRVAFIHNEKRIFTGAHHINQTISTALSSYGVLVRNFYPRCQLIDAPMNMRGLANILLFHSLLDRKDEILRYHIIQGTTYTTLPFLSFKTPVVSHFGSTTAGFLDNTPETSTLLPIEKEVWIELHRLQIIPALEYKTFRPMNDIVGVEKLVATRVTRCIATSEKVKGELIAMGVLPEKVVMISNAIEDYWFEKKETKTPPLPHLVFLGRLGSDVFTLKLKGLDRLVNFYRSFPEVPKTTICMTSNQKLKEWLKVSFPNHYLYTNLRKDLIPGALSHLFGSILFISSRYEGFSLSLVEGMSQGLVPISYPVGVAPEIIRNNENGFLVSSNEEAEEKVKFLLSNPDKRLMMAEMARKTAGQFTSKIIAAKLVSLYQKIREERRLVQ